jgi:hypothetical protein
MAMKQEYAYLYEHAYKDLKVGVRSSSEREAVTIGGKDYLVYEHASNPKTGYQGTIYQDVASGEFIVAHRGTEPPSKDSMDAKADGQLTYQYSSQ